jgi:ATP-dependent RNA helicase RhlE
MGFTKVGLSESLLQGVYATGYNRPTEIQAKVIPLIIEGRDIIGCAPTGTGKTAAFVLPILHVLEGTPVTGRRGRPRALILTPTRELAVQIEEAIRGYGTYCSQRPLCIYGGVDINRQLRGLQQGADIVVATPGRLLDHIDRRSIDLSQIEILVLDEADRMLDMGFVKDVRKIIALLPKERQTLLFSATISTEIQTLARGVLHDPLIIEIGTPFTPVDTVEQTFYTIHQDGKADLLVHVLQNEEIETALVFSRTKHGADRIAKKLHRHGILAEAIHSNRTQSQRQHTLDGFKRRHFKVLVATDVAARGIDIDSISHVVNFDIPRFAEDYIHRIGRTGRAEHTGNALTFVSADEQKYLRKIEQMVGKRCVLKAYPGFAADLPAERVVSVTQNGTASNFSKKFRFFGRRASVPTHR